MGLPAPMVGWRHCRACDVSWKGQPECWSCGAKTLQTYDGAPKFTSTATWTADVT